jgi:chromatin remodeling complex protein RSC6
MPQKSAMTTETPKKTTIKKNTATTSMSVSNTDAVADVVTVFPIEQPSSDVVDFTQVDQDLTQVMPEEPDQISIQFDGIVQTLSTFRQSITALQTQIRGLEKCVRKEVKGLRKEASKNRNKGNRKPSGFAKPSRVTDELCVFMNRDKGTEIARTEVTQFLIKYINEHSLQFAENKKVILPDATLKKLLDVKDGEEVTYFNLQGLMNKHFIKKADIPTDVAISTSV